MGHRLLSALVILCMASVQGQENAQTRLSAGLTECYQDANLFDRENRLPVTMNMLIEIIRKAEDSPEVRNDINLMTTSLIHRFRQDGIERAPGVFNSATILPFSPSGHQFTKHRILLTRLLPGNAQSFPNATLTAQERVSFFICRLNPTVRRKIHIRESDFFNYVCDAMSLRNLCILQYFSF